MSIRVAVVGSRGRMGQATVAAVQAAADLELVAQVAHAEDLAGLAGRADVAVEFTVPASTVANTAALVAAGVNVVVGTTGWSQAELQAVDAAARAAGVGVVVAPNFALSAVLAMQFSRWAAPYFESAEVIELHHPQKVDAPSGTALATAGAIAAARAAAGLGPVPDATELDPDGARGAIVDGIHVHAVRLRGLLAHEEVLFGNPGEQLSIRTDTFDRSSFMPGVLLAVRQVGGRPGLTRGLEPLLGSPGDGAGEGADG